MPKLPKLPGRDIVAVFERLGFRVARQRGSHVVLRRDTPSGATGCVIPLHKEVAVGTLASALRQAKVDPEAFLAAL